MSFRRPIPGTFTTPPRRVSFAVGRRTVPMRDISGEVVPGKPIPACLRTRLCAPSQPTR